MYSRPSRTTCLLLVLALAAGGTAVAAPALASWPWEIGVLTIGGAGEGAAHAFLALSVGGAVGVIVRAGLELRRQVADRGTTEHAPDSYPGTRRREGTMVV